MSISQFFEIFKVGFLFSYLSPLIIVIVITMIKEAYDDIKRHMQDKTTNNTLYLKHIINKDNETSPTIVEVKAEDIQCGDIIEVKENERIPADMVLLVGDNGDGKNEHLFIRTDQLDGETDWKLRKSPVGLHNFKNVSDYLFLEGFLTCGPPSKNIYNFEGVIDYIDEDSRQAKKEPLSLENTLWAGTYLASKSAIGIVVYTGIETRIQMNSSTPKIKFGALDNELNYLNKLLFGIMFLMSLIVTSFKFRTTSIGYACIIFMRYIVLFCGIIPISLRVNLDISKTFFAFLINTDNNILGTKVNNSTIPEELGRISYVFSDKTGTLTKNEMIFKKIAMETGEFGEDSFGDLKEILKDECNASPCALFDLVNEKHSHELKREIKSENHQILTDSLVDDLKETSKSYSRADSISYGSSKRRRRNRNKIIRDSIAAMVLCNNVMPFDGEYQASSPDEIALVKFAETLKMKLVSRNDQMITMTNAADETEEYEILANFPFSSSTKRMGIVLKNTKYGHIIFYLKGAENIIEKFVKPDYVGYIRENAENLARIGLRTLVLTQKIIPEEEFKEWSVEYKAAQASMENRKELIEKAISKLEVNMDFLCVTGVEDLLQDDVTQTIENLRNAGIKIWMLTGDKVETATCIAISAGLKSKGMKLYTIKSDMYKEEHLNEQNQKVLEPNIDRLRELLEAFSLSEKNSHILIIDGETLDVMILHLEEEFFKTAMNSPGVVVCRCSPTQKRIIVKTIKKYTPLITCAVGDGGNDVAMIQEADVGIGIEGKEGLQAALSSDFSIVKFNYLNTLILWWGRLAYKNTSNMSNFVIHRGLIISIIQFAFSMIFYYNPVALYNGMLILGYSTLYTNFPVMSILLDRDTEYKNVMEFPALYKILKKGRELSTKQFFFWFFKSVFQGCFIMFGSLLLFPDKIFLKIVTITFTILIFAELLNVYGEINKFHKFMSFSLIGTGFVYLLTLILMPSILDVYFIFEFKIFLKIFLLAFLTWFPFFLVNTVKKKCFPEAYQKLNLIKSENDNDNDNE